MWTISLTLQAEVAKLTESYRSAGISTLNERFVRADESIANLRRQAAEISKKVDRKYETVFIGHHQAILKLQTQIDLVDKNLLKAVRKTL